MGKTISIAFVLHLFMDLITGFVAGYATARDALWLTALSMVLWLASNLGPFILIWARHKKELIDQ